MIISYETAKALKGFLVCSVPEPVNHKWYIKNQVKPDGSKWLLQDGDATEYEKMGTICYPAYTLEDLLSKPFCEAFSNKLDYEEWPIRHDDPELVSKDLWAAYFDGGFPAVEKCLWEMMGRK